MFSLYFLSGDRKASLRLITFNGNNFDNNCKKEKNGSRGLQCHFFHNSGEREKGVMYAYL